MPFDAKTAAIVRSQTSAKADVGDNLLIRLQSAALVTAAAEYFAAKERMKADEKIVKAHGATLRKAMGSALKGIAGKHVIIRTPMAALPGTLITKDMVGQSYGGRAAYDTLSVS